MNFKYYTTTIVLILMILAFSRGFVLHYQDVSSFIVSHAHAQAAGDGGGDAGSGGVGDGGGDAGGAVGDGGGDAGGGAVGDGGGDAGGGVPGDVSGPNDVPGPVVGCMDPSATNYNPAATSQSGVTCTYPVVVYGCMDTTATNYNPAATSQMGVTCTYPVVIYGCMDTSATNYNPAATSQTGVTCTYPTVPPVVIIGCMDTSATNYNPAATSQTGVTCTYPVVVYGCMDTSATNYNPAATSQTGVTCTYPPTPKCTLVAAPNTIQVGGASILSWTTTNATSFSIDKGIGSVTPLASGSRGVTPASSITYTGTATGPGGQTICTATITVSNLPPPPPAPICTLTATPAGITPGSQSALTWTTTNATSFSIDHSVGAVTPVSAGSKNVTPDSSTTYTGTATGPGGAVTCSATVTVSVTPPPPTAPTCTLAASPTNVSPGGHTTLTWTTTNGATFAIDNGIGGVTPAIGGSVSSLAIPANTTFTGTVISPTGQSATCTAAVTVTTGGGGGAGGPTCALSVSPTSITTGNSATLSWSGSEISTVDIDNGIATGTTSPGSVKVTPSAAQTYTYTGTFHATNGQTITCAATLTVANPGGGGGGGGGGWPAPVITLASLPHVNAQPLAYLYLSQIPYTGIDLGPVGTIVYWLVLILASLGVAYFVLFYAAPFINRSVANFGERVVQVLNTEKFAPAGALAQTYTVPAPAPIKPEPIHMQAEQTHDVPRGYSTYDGFKSFAQKGALSIDDIVKGLTREHAMRTRTESNSASKPASRNVEPIYENVEEIAEPAPIAHEAVPSPLQSESVDMSVASADVRGFTAALLDGDREAVFAGLRQHIRGGGKAEKLLSATAFLLDDAYRARTDGTACDADIARLAARFSTPVLEKLVTSLTTAIDSSYSADVTGAKLALTRALAVLGA